MADRCPRRPWPPHEVRRLPRATTWKTAGGVGRRSDPSVAWCWRRAPPSPAAADSALQSRSSCRSQLAGGWWPARVELSAPPHVLSPPIPTAGSSFHPPDLCGRLPWPCCFCRAKTPIRPTPPARDRAVAAPLCLVREPCRCRPAPHVGTMEQPRVSTRKGQLEEHARGNFPLPPSSPEMAPFHSEGNTRATMGWVVGGDGC